MASQPNATVLPVVSKTASQPDVAAPSLVSGPNQLVSTEQKVALPLHVQKLQGALCLDRLIDQVERVFNDSLILDKSVR